MGIANIAATNMEHLCNCSSHGYSQSERWGNSSYGACSVECEGHVSTFYMGDRDCSSAVIDSWREALIGTPYEGALDAATYTGNMKSVFVDSGLFSWEPMSYTAKRGDIYLNEADHTAMCVNDSPDLLAEFSISETGGIYGQSGDQTGGESSIHGYYDYPWNGILAYNGKADGAETSCGTPQPRYRVKTDKHGWLDYMDGTRDSSGTTDDFAGYEDEPITDFEIDAPYDLEWLGSQVRGIIIHDSTVKYQVKVTTGKWLNKVEYGDSDNGAGDDEHAIIAVRCWR